MLLKFFPPIAFVSIFEQFTRYVLNEQRIKGREKKAEKLTQAARYERNEARQGYRSGHYSRNLTTTSGDITLYVPRLWIKKWVKTESKNQSPEKVIKTKNPLISNEIRGFLQ